MATPAGSTASAVALTYEGTSAVEMGAPAGRNDPAKARQRPLPDPKPVERHGPARIVAMCNQKGGVGKTTTAINIAAALAISGRRVLLVDLDPQGNASTGLGIERNARQHGTYATLLDQTPITEAVTATAVPNLDLLPADNTLAGAEIELATLPRREFKLDSALRAAAGRYDDVLIDCPPSLGLLTLNGLTAADAVLIPLQCEFFALEGLSQLTQTIERVRTHLNPDLTLLGIVLTMFDRRNNLSELVAADVRKFFGRRVYETVIPRNVRVSEAPSHGKPVMLYDMRSPGAQAYIRLAGEILRAERAAA